MCFSKRVPATIIMDELNDTTIESPLSMRERAKMLYHHTGSSPRERGEERGGGDEERGSV